jgi:hypothetical protein
MPGEKCSLTTILHILQRIVLHVMQAVCAYMIQSIELLLVTAYIVGAVQMSTVPSPALAKYVVFYFGPG